MGSKHRYIAWKRLTEEAAEELERLHKKGKAESKELNRVLKPADFIKKWRK